MDCARPPHWTVNLLRAAAPAPDALGAGNIAHRTLPIGEVEACAMRITKTANSDRRCARSPLGRADRVSECSSG